MPGLCGRHLRGLCHYIHKMKNVRSLSLLRACSLRRDIQNFQESTESLSKEIIAAQIDGHQHALDVSAKRSYNVSIH